MGVLVCLLGATAGRKVLWEVVGGVVGVRTERREGGSPVQKEFTTNTVGEEKGEFDTGLRTQGRVVTGSRTVWDSDVGPG